MRLKAVFLPGRIKGLIISKIGDWYIASNCLRRSVNFSVSVKEISIYLCFHLYALSRAQYVDVLVRHKTRDWDKRPEQQGTGNRSVSMIIPSNS